MTSCLRGVIYVDFDSTKFREFLEQLNECAKYGANVWNEFNWNGLNSSGGFSAHSNKTEAQLSAIGQMLLPRIVSLMTAYRPDTCLVVHLSSHNHKHTSYYIVGNARRSLDVNSKEGNDETKEPFEL